MKTSSRGRWESHTIWGTFDMLPPFRFELVPDIITWQPMTVVDGGEETLLSQFQSGSTFQSDPPSMSFIMVGGWHVIIVNFGKII